jgi:SAM domain (Sterile alpha motif)
MQQIADWLEKLGMSEYTQRFADNDIDFAILSELTDHCGGNRAGFAQARGLRPIIVSDA